MHVDAAEMRRFLAEWKSRDLQGTPPGKLRVMSQCVSLSVDCVAVVPLDNVALPCCLRANCAAAKSSHFAETTLGHQDNNSSWSTHFSLRRTVVFLTMLRACNGILTNMITNSILTEQSLRSQICSEWLDLADVRL